MLQNDISVIINNTIICSWNISSYRKEKQKYCFVTELLIHAVYTYILVMFMITFIAWNIFGNMFMRHS